MARVLLRGAAARAYRSSETVEAAMRRLAEGDRALRAREKYMDVPPPAGSWEEEEGAILDAARKSDKFGGPAREYNDPLSTDDTPRDYHFSLLAAFPHDHKATISNSKTGALYHAKYERATDGAVSFTSVDPAQLEVTTKAAEAIKTMREAGRVDPQHVPFTLYSPVREVKDNGNGTYEIVALTVGPGNPVDNNWYTRSFVEDAVALLAGNRSNYDHPTPTQEREIPEGSVHRLAGWFKNVRLDEAYVPPGATEAVAAARATFVPRRGDDRIDSLIRTCQEHAAEYPQKAPLVAFSINGMGVGSLGAAPDGSGEKNLVEHMTTMASTDIVTSAGARGRFDFGGQPVKTRRAQSGTRESGGFLRFASGEVIVDHRTPDEIKKDGEKKTTVIRRVLAESALNGPNGTKIREALGVDVKKPTKSFTDDELVATLEKLIGVGGAFETALSEAIAAAPAATVENDEDEDGDEDEDEHEGEHEGTVEAGGRKIVHEVFSDDELDKMTPSARRKAKKLMKGARKAADAAKSKESARADALEAQINAIGKARVIGEAMAQRKVHENYRPIVEALCETAKTAEEIGARVHAYAASLGGQPDGAGAVFGSTRESQTAGGGYAPAFEKE